MIRELTKSKDIIGLMEVKDDLEYILPCSKAEFLQWLTSTKKSNNKIKIWIWEENNKIDSYVIVFDSITPPIINFVTVFYTFGLNIDKLFEEVFRWMKSIPCRKIVMETKILTHDLEEIGFQKMGISIAMEV